MGGPDNDEVDDDREPPTTRRPTGCDDLPADSRFRSKTVDEAPASWCDSLRWRSRVSLTGHAAAARRIVRASVSDSSLTTEISMRSSSSPAAYYMYNVT